MSLGDCEGEREVDAGHGLRPRSDPCRDRTLSRLYELA